MNIRTAIDLVNGEAQWTLSPGHGDMRDAENADRARIGDEIVALAASHGITYEVAARHLLDVKNLAAAEISLPGGWIWARDGNGYAVGVCRIDVKDGRVFLKIGESERKEFADLRAAMRFAEVGNRLPEQEY